MNFSQQWKAMNACHRIGVDFHSLDWVIEKTTGPRGDYSFPVAKKDGRVLLRWMLYQQDFEYFDPAKEQQ